MIRYDAGSITFYNLIELLNFKLKPEETWSIIWDTHKINHKFSTGLLGKTGFQVLEIIAKLFKHLDKEIPKIKFKDEDDIEQECSFWGDYQFLEQLAIDIENKNITLYVGS